MKALTILLLFAVVGACGSKHSIKAEGGVTVTHTVSLEICNTFTEQADREDCIRTLLDIMSQEKADGPQPILGSY